MELLALSFIIITALTIIVFYLAVGRDKRILGALALWTAVVGWSAYGGFFENTSTIPPRILLLLLPLVVLMIVLYRQIAVARTNLLLLTAVHIVRISVELILYGLYLREKIPVGMTYAGWNFDIVVGISAIPLLIYWFWKSPNPTLLRGWNYFGLAMLSIIIVTAILSTPGPLQQMAFEQPNVAILTYPFTLLPGVVVPLVALSHLLSLKKIGYQSGTVPTADAARR
ncbi:MAG: hypothetical protein WA958_01125 [Tunicatimonas sp.]